MTKLVFISDTHNKHNELVLPDGDILIHCGDSTMTGSEEELKKFLSWFGKQPHINKVLIFGNHDLGMDSHEVYNKWAEPRGRGYRDVHKIRSKALELIALYGIHFLEDSGVEIEGLKFWGSPVQPAFHAWAFNRERGDDIQKHWDMIPDDTEVLLSHGPPKFIMDYVPYTNENVGCTNLSETINSRLHSLRIHAFGHIHNKHGIVEDNDLTYVNASNLNDYYDLTYEPITVEISK